MNKNLPARALDFLRAVPLKLVLVLIVLSMTLKNPDDKAEFYPFSNYPMYSQFDEQDYYVYIADSQGNPLPSKEYGITTPKIKKRFKKRLGETAKRLGVKKMEVAGAELEAVAIATLKTLDDPRTKKLDGMQLFYVDLRKEGGTITKSERLIGEIAIEKEIEKNGGTD